MNPLRPLVVLALLAGAAAAVSVTENEPDGFTSPLPQPLGTMGAGGLSVDGVLDNPDQPGGAVGDHDGFSFTMGAEGPFRAVVTGGSGTTFALGLGEDTSGGFFIRSVVLGPSPLTLSRPFMKAGSRWRVGVAAIGGAGPLPYGLVLDSVDAVAPWTGAPCDAPSPEAEPNEDILTATDFGWFDRILCAEGDVSVVSPVESGITGDVDHFRFRNVLPVAAKLHVLADPGTLDIEVDQLHFVGPFAVASRTFGIETTLDLPKLEPGGDYVVRISARAGDPPVHYSFQLEPTGPSPEDPPEPMFLEKSLLRLGPDARRSRFSVSGTFEPGLGDTLGEGTSVILTLRGGETALASGKIEPDPLGRLVWKAPKGLTGIRKFFFDSIEGIVRIEGKGVDLAGDFDPADPSIPVEIDLGAVRIGTTGTGEFSRKGRVLRLK